jgi:hypothetical protein
MTMMHEILNRLFSGNPSILSLTAVGSFITAASLFVNAWIKRRAERKKWIINRIEQSYTKCLRLLSQARRTPLKIGDKKLLEYSSYQGLLCDMREISGCFIMIQCYSSERSGSDIELARKRIEGVVDELRRNERVFYDAKGSQLPDKEKTGPFICIGEYSETIERALSEVKECYQRELYSRVPKPVLKRTDIWPWG